MTANTNVNPAPQQRAEKITTPEFRVAFAQVFEPKANQNGQMRYSLVALFPRGTDLSIMRRIAGAAVLKAWGANPPAFRNPFRNGDEKPYDGYRGCIYCTLSSRDMPGVVRQNNTTILDQKEFYSGVWARATVHAYCYDNTGNKGVNFELHNIQKVRDDVPFSGKGKAEDDFEPIPMEQSLAEDVLMAGGVEMPRQVFMNPPSYPATPAPAGTPVPVMGQPPVGGVNNLFNV